MKKGNSLEKTNHWSNKVDYKRKGSFQSVVGCKMSSDKAFTGAGCGTHSCDNPGCNGVCSG